MKAIVASTLLVGLALAAVNCSHNSDHAKDPSAAEQRRIDERRAEQRAEERRIEEHRAEQRADERRAEDRREAAYVGGGPADPASAVSKIASARCDREVRCNNVGTKEKYSSRADCVVRNRDDRRDDINEKDCPGGIDHRQFNACLVAIRDEACGNPLDTISRLAACRSGAICLK